MKVVIVGGVAGGASTAARLRRVDEFAEIVLLERGPYISFANCGLPYYIGGVIPERDSLLVTSPETLRAYFNIDARINSEVVRIDRQARQVTVHNLATGQQYQESYDRLVLSPGANPLVPPIPGRDLPGVFALRNIPDMDRIVAYMDEVRPSRAVVVGGGFIGIELAENLHRRGILVTLVEMMNQVMAPLDYEMAAMVHQHMQFKQVRLVLGDGIQAIEPREGNWLSVVLQSGRRADAEMVILAIGVRPEYQLAKEAGLDIGVRGTIATNAHLQTSDPDIYAIGDAAQVTHIVTQEPTNVPLAGPASKQGRMVADHIAGRQAVYKGAQGTAIVKVFDLSVATTGLNQSALDRAGRPYQSAIIHVANHAGYYPGASPMAVKMLFGPEGQIYGAQIVGMDGVDKRIDVLATALRAGLTVYDLEELELGYAPPYGSTRDPVNIIGFVAANILRGDLAVTTWDQIAELDRDQTFVLDVRNPEELTIGALDRAVNIPLGQLRSRLNEIPKDRHIVVYCQAGQRAYFACRMLNQHGFETVNLSGGFKTYSHAVQRQSNFDVFEHVAIDSHEEIREVPPPVIVKGREFAVDACGLQCPGPILRLFNKVKEVEPGDVITITATDFGFVNDVRAWCERTGNTLISLEQEGAIIWARIQKGQVVQEEAEAAADQGRARKGKTIVVFSGDLDKALAAFIIANGAVSMGHPVTMFFTFWGLNILRRRDPPATEKTVIERALATMMPQGADRLALSKMHMAGMGTAMIKSIMKDKNVDALPVLIETARQNGVRLLACQMTMDLMSIRREELIDGIEIAGVATFVASSDDSNATLFI